MSIPNGAYWIDENGTWSVTTPNGRLGSVAKHTVVEHEDRTITVSPSILVYAVEGCTYEPEERARLVASHGEDTVQSWERGRPAWHGFLERGVWREC
jgi:hypothetical protein